MSHLTGDPLSAIDIFVLISAVFLFIVGLSMHKNYKLVNLPEIKIYLIFFLILVPINNVEFVIRHHTESAQILLYGINLALFSTLFLLIFLHSSYVYWDKIPMRVVIPVIIWHIFITLPYFFMDLEINLSSGQFFMFDIYGDNTFDDLKVPIMIVNGNIISGEGYPILENLTRLLIGIFSIGVYLRIDMGNTPNSIRRARAIWLFVLISWTVRPLSFVIRIFFDINILGGAVNLFFILVTSLYFGYFAWKNPMSLVISKHQLIRAANLYEKIDYTKIQEPAPSDIREVLKNYIESFPTELREELGI